MSFPEHLSGGDGTRSATLIVSVSKADADLTNGVCRALCCGTAGTANLMDANGNIITNFPLQQGYNPICVKQVRTGGGASDIWALY